MNSIDIRTGEAGKIDTIIFADVGYRANAIRFDSGDVDFIQTDDVDCVDLSLTTVDAYNLYLALGKALELGLITAPKPPAAKKAAPAKKA